MCVQCVEARVLLDDSFSIAFLPYCVWGGGAYQHSSVGVCMWVCTYVETRGWHHTSSSVTVCLYLIMELTGQPSRICLPPPCKHWGNRSTSDCSMCWDLNSHHLSSLFLETEFLTGCGAHHLARLAASKHQGCWGSRLQFWRLCNSHCIDDLSLLPTFYMLLISSKFSSNYWIMLHSTLTVPGLW